MMTPHAVKLCLTKLDFLAVEHPAKQKRVTAVFKKGNITAKVQDYPERDRKYLFLEAKISEFVLNVDHIPFPESADQLRSKVSAFCDLVRYVEGLPIYDYRYK